MATRLISLAEFEGAERALKLFECYKQAAELIHPEDVAEMQKYLFKGKVSAGVNEVLRVLSNPRRHY